MSSRSHIALIATFLLTACASKGDLSKDLPAPTQEINIFKEDIPRFWQAFDAAKGLPQEKQIEVFDNHYYLPGSAGLKAFYKSRITDTKTLVETINAVPEYYEAIRPYTLQIDRYTPDLHKLFLKFKQLYPNAKNVNIYLLIGRLASAGTIADQSLFIGLELFGNGMGIDRKIIPEHIKLYENSPKKLQEVIMHEIIHTQQDNGNLETLLQVAINEGSADFLTELTMGTHPYKNLYAYGYKNEAKIWKEFKKKMNGTEISEFLYNVSTSKNPDLGYFVGYRIAQSYYNKASDKKKAIEEILTSKSLDTIFERSGYDPK